MIPLGNRVRALGPVIQMAWIPRNYSVALAWWTEVIGAGPFFEIPHLPLSDVKYRGRPVEVDTGVALGYWGDTQIELLRQHDDGPCVYREWRESGREGMHHVCIAVEDMGAAGRVLSGLGGVPVHEARMEGAAQAAYYELPGPGPVIEIARLEPRFTSLFDYMRDAARTWDGRDPVRPVPPEEEWNPAART